MSTSDVLDDLRSRILSQYALLFLRTWEEERWENELATLALEMERGLVVWSATRGAEPPLAAGDGAVDPVVFLEQVEAYPSDHLFLVKDFHPYLSDPRVVRKLRDLAAGLAANGKTLLFVGPVADVPLELRKDAVRIELPLPGLEELRDELALLLDEQAADSGRMPDLAVEEQERLLKAVLGLTAREARQALRRALLGRETLDDDVYALLVAEKRQMVQGSELLEFYDHEEGARDVGGLDNLKEWLVQRAEAFSTRAAEQGIPIPKGVLLLGVQGCGKSLTARATARMLSFPLVRLDVSHLLGGERGQSERNLRDVLRLMETIAPAVLWLDEIDKGFAGFEGEAVQDPTMARLVGSFLTWMEERRAPVFVVATANSVTGLPPELLRRGRFDELFFIDLPNYHERKDIFDVHLSRRGWKPEKYDLEELARQTEGFSGAEIEQVVVAAMLDAYGRGNVLGQEDLESARDSTVPLSVTMEERIFELREWARARCRPATPDSRVMQMLDEEHRRGESLSADESERSRPDEAWKSLAEHGQLNAAVAELVRRRDQVTFPELQQALSEYLDTQGDQGLALRSDPNVVLWVGMGGELAELLSKLITAKRLYLHPADLDRYKSQGEGVKLPLLKELPDERLSKPAWLPACFRTIPPEGGTGRFARVARMKLVVR